MSDARAAADDALRPEHVRVVRVGHGGNCSSVGSVIDTLFLGAAAGGAVFAALLAALADEEVRVVGEPPAPAEEPADADADADADAEGARDAEGRPASAAGSSGADEDAP